MRVRYETRVLREAGIGGRPRRPRQARYRIMETPVECWFGHVGLERTEEEMRPVRKARRGF